MDYYLPDELLTSIFKELSYVDLIYVKAVCKTFDKLVKLDTVNTFKLYDTANVHEFVTMNEFVDYIYNELHESPFNEISYHLLRMRGISIRFIKRRVGPKYNYSVQIEERGDVRIRMFYEGRSKRYKCYKFMNREVEFPILFYMLGMRFLIKIYRRRDVDYNFDVDCMPKWLFLTLSENYRGQMFDDLLRRNIHIE